MTVLSRIAAVTAFVAIALVAANVHAQAIATPTGLAAEIAKARWQTEVPGVERLAFAGGSESRFRAFRLAPDKVTTRVLSSLDPTGSSAPEMMAASRAVLIVNGGFFYVKSDGGLAPTGLLTVDGSRRAPLRRCRACTAVLYTDAEGVHIGRPAELAGKRGIVSALQVGPMLVEAGKVMAFNSEGPAAPRTAVCLTADAIVAVATTQLLTLHELAGLLAAKLGEGGFECAQAINLDGGSSTQMVTDLPSSKGLLGFAVKVQNFVAFFTR